MNDTSEQFSIHEQRNPFAFPALILLFCIAAPIAVVVLTISGLASLARDSSS